MTASPDARIANFARTLEQRAEALENSIARERTRREDWAARANEVPDSGDDSAANQQHAIEQAEMDREIAELRAIRLAQHRLNDGEYGYCIDCGDDIPERRLIAQPAAERCVHCQERHERQMGGNRQLLAQ